MARGRSSVGTAVDVRGSDYLKQSFQYRVWIGSTAVAAEVD